MAYHYEDCVITGIQNINENVKRFFIKFPETVSFHFTPGQFVMLNLPIEAKVTNRSYSIASPPSGDNVFELVIVLNPKGMGTPYLWEKARVGDTIKVSKALGKFSLPAEIEYDLCFICTGTGIAPLRSMVMHIFNHQIPHRNIYMVSGNRWVKDILYREEMEMLSVKHPEFRFIPVLSRENPGWTGHKGYVHPVYEELFSDKRPGYFYLCGWKDMLKEARTRLNQMGYNRQFVRFESYD